MPVIITEGNLLHSRCDILINTVNCVGVMGAGIALDFKESFPSMYKKYKSDCKTGKYSPGCIYEYALPDHRILINFTTKDHWIDNSEIEWIESGLIKLRSYLEGTTYSVALPALGCNNGKLDWVYVSDMVHRILDPLDNHIELYKGKNK